MAYLYRVELSEDQRAYLRGLVGSGIAPARTLTRARILLKANHGEGGPGLSDATIAGALDINPSTVLRVRRQYVQAGLAATLARKRPDRVYERTLDGDQEAKLVALACSETPAGADHWSLRLLADELVRLEVVPTISYETVRQTLKKNDVKPWLREQWCFAPTASFEFVWHMEDVLEVDHRPVNPARPVVCVDETSRQLLGEVRQPLRAGPGRPPRHDPEDVRGGVVNLFLATEPLHGWRTVMVSDQRTRLDFARCIKQLVDVHYPAAEQIVLVLDQLNTHSPASLYEAFPPAEAKRLTDKLEIHHTPKHGSWLNMAELELSVLQRQCLRQRVADRSMMEREVTAWSRRRNTASERIDWQFTTADARTKLRRLDPAVED